MLIHTTTHYESFTGIVDTPVASHFTYQPGETWKTFYDPFFEPIYQPVFADPGLEARAVELCGEDPFCQFDVAATSDIDIGQSTLEGGQLIQEITDLQVSGFVCRGMLALIAAWKQGFILQSIAWLFHDNIERLMSLNFKPKRVATLCILICTNDILSMRRQLYISR